MGPDWDVQAWCSPLLRGHVISNSRHRGALPLLSTSASASGREAHGEGD